MAFTPVEFTNGTAVRLAETPDDLVQLEFDGWVPVGGTYDPPLPDGSPGPAVPTTQDFIGMMNAVFVRKDDLVIAPEPPATPKGPGTIHIDNSVS
jgi:hypothetical protein